MGIDASVFPGHSTAPNKVTTGPLSVLEHMEYCISLPLLLHIKECHGVSVLQQEVASPSIEDGVTRGTLHLLRHFVAKVLDDQLQQCKHYK